MDRLRFESLQVWRSLTGRLGSTTAVVLTLALGLGLAGAVFAVVDPFLLAPLSYHDADRLMVIETSIKRDGESVARVPMLADWQSRDEIFESVAAFGPEEQLRIEAANGAVLLRIIPVSTNFLDVLYGGSSYDSVWETRGETTGVKEVSVTGSALERLGGRIGSHAIVDGGSLQVSSRLPESFLFPHPYVHRRPDAIRPHRFGPTIDVSLGRVAPVTVIGKVRKGITPAQVQGALEDVRAGYRITVQPIADHLKSRLRPLAAGALGASLLIAVVCLANVLNLLLARVAYRGREFGTRKALGASERNLLIHLSYELAAMTALGVAGALFLTQLCIVGMTQVIPAEYVAFGEPAITARVVTFSLALGVVVFIASFLAVRSSVKLPPGAREDLGGRADLLGARALRMLMVASQTAVACVLVVAGTLLVRSYVNLMSQETGFAANVGLVSVLYPRHQSPSVVREEVDVTLRALSHVPGVQRAAVVAGPMLDRFGVIGGTPIRIAGRILVHSTRQVSVDYFEAAGITLKAGRNFTETDREWNAVIINEVLARRLWPDREPRLAVGEHFALASGAAAGEVVGVVQNTHDRSLDVAPASIIYRPLVEPRASLPIHFVMSLADQSPTVITQATTAITKVSDDVVVSYAGLLRDRLSYTVNDRTFATLVLFLFASAGIGVTASGLFGIIAFVVGRRTREIAIRRAVGASNRHILFVVTRDAALAAGVGTASGLLLGFVGSKLLASQLYGLAPGDLPSMLTAGALMLFVVIIAAWIPAARALRMMPTIALRID